MLHKGPRGTRERIASHRERSARPDPRATGDLLILSISFSSIHDYDRLAWFAAITKLIRISRETFVAFYNQNFCKKIKISIFFSK